MLSKLSPFIVSLTRCRGFCPVLTVDLREGDTHVPIRGEEVRVSALLMDLSARRSTLVVAGTVARVGQHRHWVDGTVVLDLS